MATSGYIKTNVEYDSFFWVRWEIKSQNAETNKTTIAWRCGVTCGHSFYSNAIKWTKALYINGVLVYSGGTYSNYAKGDHTMASGQLDIPHGTDGKKTFNISSFAGWLYSNYTYDAAATAHELTPIPRKATIIEVNDFTDLDNPSFTFSNPGGFPMDVWLEPNPVGDHLCIRENIANAGGYTWILTDDEREQLRSKCPGKDCTIRVGLYTHIGGTTYHDYRDKKFTMVESDATRPAVSLTVSLNNDVLRDRETFAGLYIQQKSRVDVEVGGEGKYGATISNRYASVGGSTYQYDKFTSFALWQTGEVAITGYAVDSRGFTGKAETTVNVIPYSKPLVVPLGNENAILCYRSDGNGKRAGSSTSVWIKAKRSYYDVNGKNTCALQWRRKPASNIWDDATHTWSDLIPNTSTTDEYNALLSGVVFEKKQAYTVQIRAIDDIGDFDIKTFEIPTEDVALHLGRGGKNVSVGTYCNYDEDYTFYSEWKGIFPAGINGVFMHSKHITGEELHIKTKFDDWNGTGEEYQTFILFGGHEFAPVFIVCHVGSSGGASCLNEDDSARFRDGAPGVLDMMLPRVADGKFTVISADPIEIL